MKTLLEAEDLHTDRLDVLIIKRKGVSIVGCRLSLSKPIEWINTADISMEYFRPKVLWEIPYRPLDFPWDAQSFPITHRAFLCS